MAECAVPMGSRARAVPAAARPLRARRVVTVLGDIGEEITEIELEPLPEGTPADAPEGTPADAPAAPDAEPVPG